MERKDVLKEESFAFAVKVVHISKALQVDTKEYVLSRQLLRSGTAIGALIRESKNAESKADFIHKLAIAQKECDETGYWLELLYAVTYISKESFDVLSNQNISLLRMIRSSIMTTRKNMKQGE